MARFDDIGLFWQDIRVNRKADRINLPMPEVLETGWTAPTSFPNLACAQVISLDTETFDPNLIEKGPGWVRNDGHIVGVSLGARASDGTLGQWYFPVRHEGEPETNMDPAQVFTWLAHVLGNNNQPKIGANLTYDVGWLRHEGIHVAGDLVDVQFAEALLSEGAPVALEELGQKYLGEGKESNYLYQWLADWFGGNPTGKQRKWIYKAPPRMVGPYAESDANLPLRLASVLYPLLVREGLLNVFIMECKLIRLMIDMRYAGVNIDIDAAEKLRVTLQIKQDEEQAKLDYMCGIDVNVNSSDSIAPAFDTFGIPYNWTKPSKNFPEGKPSFTKAFLESVDHPVANVIKEVRKLAKLKGTFVESYLLDSHVNGMVYGQFHQLRSDDGGTRSGRLSSSTPNLQNIPSRDPILAPLIRGLFIPDYGHIAWRKYDYSQIEYRLLIHFAVGAAGDAIRDYFWANPKTDYHVYMQELVKAATGILIDRKPIKSINFGLIYGMGVKTLAATLKLSVKAAKALMDSYFIGVPFAKPTMDAAIKEALTTGVITTIIGRKSRFDLWEPAKWGQKAIPLPLHLAQAQYGSNIKRAASHKALNRRLQGSAADIMKVSMLKCYEDGIYDYIGVPRLTVHDENNHSDFGGVNDGYLAMQHIFETAIPVNVPIKLDGDIGPDWGHVVAITPETENVRYFFK